MNYSDLNAVGRLEKLELGITLPSSVSTYVNNFIAKQLNPNLSIDPSLILNPFLEWELDVEAIFVHQATGYTKVSDGFFTRDYVRNTSNNLWDDLNTPYPMRVRFAPPNNGEWKCYVLVKTNNVTVATSSEFRFNVVESGSKGYVWVADNKRNLKRNGQYIFPVGQNFPYPFTYVNDYDNVNITPTTTHLNAKVDAWVEYLKDISDYAQLGGRFIRTIQNPNSSLIEFEKKGNYFDRLHYAWEQDNLMDLCKQYDILVMFNLMHQNGFQMRAEGNITKWDWDRWWDIGGTVVYDNTDQYPVNCYNDNPGPNGKKAYECFVNENDLKYHEQRTRYYIARYGYSTQIYEFEILSEPYHLDQKTVEGVVAQEPYLDPSNPLHNPVINAVGVYQSRISNYIRNTMNHYEHLIGINAITPAWNKNESQIVMDDSRHSSNIDIIGINPYQNPPDNLLLSDIYALNEASLAKMIQFFGNSGNGKPVIISEGGHNGFQNGVDCADFKMEFVDNMTFGFLGACGFNMWHILKGNYNGIWENQINVKNHMNGNDVISTISNGGGFWNHRRSKEKLYVSHEVPLKETQMYISADQEKAVGYVRIRTYNYQTTDVNGCGIQYEHEYNTFYDFSWNTGINRLYAEGLKNNTDYRVHWYRENSWIKSECRNTTLSGKFELEFPDLTVNPWYTGTSFNPIVWFVIYQENCQSGLAQSGGIEEYEHVLKNTENQEIFLMESDYSLGINPNPIMRMQDLIITSPVNQNVIFSNSQGMKIKQLTIDEGRTNLSLKDFDTGVYYLYFEDNNKVIKLVVL